MKQLKHFGIRTNRNSRSKEDSMWCPRCQKFFSTEEMSAHLISSHLVRSDNMSKNKKEKCTLCNGTGLLGNKTTLCYNCDGRGYL